MKENTKILAQRQKEMNDAYLVLESLGQTEKGRGLLAKSKASAAVAEEAHNRVLELAKAGKRDEATKVYVEEARPLALAITAAMQELVQYEEGEMGVAREAASRETRRYQVVLVMLGLVGLSAVVAATIYLTRSIASPAQGRGGTGEPPCER